MNRLCIVVIVVSIGILGAGIAHAEIGALVRELPVADECVAISLTGRFATKPAADVLSPMPAHFAGFRREAMNAMAAQKRPKADRVSEIAVNAVAGSSLTVPAALLREALLGLSADEEAVAGLRDGDYTANYLDSGAYLFEISIEGPAEYRALTAQPFLAFVEPDKPLGLRLEVMMYAVDAARSIGTGQIVYPYPVCLTGEIATSNLTVNFGRFGTVKDGGIVVTPGAIHVLAGTDYTPYVPPESVADEAPVEKPADSR